MSHTTPSLPAVTHVLAVDIGGTKVDAALVSASGEVVRASVNRRPTGREDRLDVVQRQRHLPVEVAAVDGAVRPRRHLAGHEEEVPGPHARAERHSGRWDGFGKHRGHGWLRTVAVGRMVRTHLRAGTARRNAVSGVTLTGPSAGRKVDVKSCSV